MREEIWLCFSDCKGSKPAELSKFNTSGYILVILYVIFYKKKDQRRTGPGLPPPNIGILFIDFIITFI
jgi:hypothetical protein